MAIVVLAVIMSFVSVQVIHESVQKIVIYATKDYSQQLKRIRDWSTSVAVANLTEGSNGTTSDSSALSLVMELVHLLEDCASGNHAPVFETPTIVICLATVGRPKITIMLFSVNFIIVSVAIILYLTGPPRNAQGPVIFMGPSRVRNHL